jgi:hypothetical protein
MLNSLVSKIRTENKSQVYRKPKGGLEELRKHGRVRHHERIGYCRPDRPPAQLPSGQGGN